MRFLMMVKAPENSGPPPKELMDAMGKLAEEAMKSGEMIETGDEFAGDPQHAPRIALQHFMAARPIEELAVLE